MFSYYRRQDNQIDNGMVEVSYIVSVRQGCAPVMCYEYDKNFENAMKRARSLCHVVIGNRALVCDFAGRAVPVTA